MREAERIRVLLFSQELWVELVVGIKSQTELPTEQKSQKSRLFQDSEASGKIGWDSGFKIENSGFFGPLGIFDFVSFIKFKICFCYTIQDFLYPMDRPIKYRESGEKN